ncbi:MAG: helix-turn-helix domain-containing protein [Lachnospiraceae bacterium]
MNEMNFREQLQSASSNSRYQQRIMEHMIIPDPCTSYAFQLHALTKTHGHYPYELSFTGIPAYVFLYTMNGNANLYLGEQIYELEKESIAWFDCSNGFHTEITKTNQDWEFILLFASGDTMPNYHNTFYKNHGITISTKNSPNIPAVLHQLYASMLSILENGFHGAIIYSKLICDLSTYLTLDSSIQNRYGSVPKQIVQIISYIQNHYAEKITLDTLSVQFATSKYSLSRDFTNYMNQSLIDFLIDYRISESQKLLIFTNDSITDIAEATGFSTVTNFIQQFKKRTDLTPNAYRKQNQIYSSKQALANPYSHIII